MKFSDSHPAPASPAPAASGSRGSAAFFILVIIPLVAALAAVAVDAAAWFSMRDEAQHFADTLALQAAAFLPDALRAAAFVRDARPPRSISAATARASFPEGTSLTVEVRIAFRYDGALLRAFPESRDNMFFVERRAVAEVVPSDTIVVAADGASLRPRLARVPGGVEEIFDAPWGEALDWPASGYFDCASAPEPSSDGRGGPSPSLWSNPRFRRWATQSCFNPVLSPLKLGLIRLLDELTAARENGVGFLFTPGNGPDGGFAVLRRLEGGNEPFLEAPVFWPGYIESGLSLGDETCMLLSNPASAFSGRYTLPGTGSTAVRQCGDSLEYPVCGAPHRPAGHLRQCLLAGSLSLREAVYWHTPRLETRSAPDLAASLAEARRQLSAARPVRNDAPARRGDLGDKALRRIVLVSDVLPPPGSGAPSLVDLISSLERSRVALVLVAYSHEGLSDSHRTELRENARAFAGLEAAHPSLRVLSASSPADLERNILPFVSRIDRQVVLRE